MNFASASAILRDAYTAKYPVFRGTYAQLVALLEATRGASDRSRPVGIAERLGVRVEWVEPLATVRHRNPDWTLTRRQSDGTWEPWRPPELGIAMIEEWQRGRHGAEDTREWRGPVDPRDAARKREIGLAEATLRRAGYRVERP